MTKKELAILATIPDVLKVLRKLAEETEEIRQLSAVLGAVPVPIPRGGTGNQFQEPAGTTGTVATFAQMDAIAAQRQAPQSPQPVVLRTPEREEYEASLRQPAAQPAPSLINPERRAAQQAFLASVRSERAEKLAQFKKQPGVDPVAEVAAEQLDTLSEAT